MRRPAEWLFSTRRAQLTGIGCAAWDRDGKDSSRSSHNNHHGEAALDHSNGLHGRGMEISPPGLATGEYRTGATPIPGLRCCLEASSRDSRGACRSSPRRSRWWACQHHAACGESGSESGAEAYETLSRPAVKSEKFGLVCGRCETSSGAGKGPPRGRPEEDGQGSKTSRSYGWLHMTRSLQ